MGIEIDENITTNTNSTVIDWPGGPGTLTVHGTFDSATAKLQSSIDGGSTYQDVEDASNAVELAVNGDKGFSCTARKLRVNVAGGGGSLDINVMVKPDRREFVGTVA